MSKEAGFGLDL